MSLIKRLFRKPSLPRRQPIARSCRSLSISERLDISLRAGAFDARLWAWGV